MRILIADDEPVVLYLMSGHLTDWGFEVVTARDGADAWRLLQESSFDLVISDWMMPEMDGPDLFRLIRSDERFAYVYLILLTAKSRPEDVVEGMESGADDFLTKPIHRDELRVRIEGAKRTIELEQNLHERNRQLEEFNAKVIAANRRMTRDLQAGARVQQALLPTLPPPVSCASFAWRLQPCDELAGDILNVMALDERDVAMYVLDVTGHGVSAALLSVTVSWFLRQLSEGRSSLRKRAGRESDRRLVPPAEVADLLNRRFRWDDAAKQFFTLAYGVLDCERSQFRCVAAGHAGPLYLPKDAAPQVLHLPSYPIGIVEDATYQEQTIDLRAGDRVFLFTDGITEANSRTGEPFNESGLVASLMRTRGLPLEESLASLFEDLNRWTGGAPQNDDASIVALEYHGPNGAKGL